MTKPTFSKKHSEIFFRYLLFPLLMLLTAALLSQCGYTNPYVQKIPAGTEPITLYVTTWQNRTNELGLESKYLRTLTSWFKKSDIIHILFEKENADLKLTGEITSIDLPGLFYDSFDEALEIDVKLTVNFTLYDNHSNSIVWQEKDYTVSEPFLLNPKGGQTDYNKNRALLHIGDKIAEFIYLRTNEIASDMIR